MQSLKLKIFALYIIEDDAYVLKYLLGAPTKEDEAHLLKYHSGAPTKEDEAYVYDYLLGAPTEGDFYDCFYGMEDDG